VEAEKFIRLRGLSRKKSRKVRLLHHCYVFERLFHESTFLHDTDSPQRQHVRKVIESSGLAVHSRDSLSYRLPNFSNLEEEMSVLKSQETGENDLHLELPGEFPPTLYPEIFGVPEPWMLLLSLTIRLGKEKDSAETEGQSNALCLSSFMARAKAIERRIHLLQRLASGTTDAFSSLQSEKDLQVLDNMLDAVRHARLLLLSEQLGFGGSADTFLFERGVDTGVTLPVLCLYAFCLAFRSILTGRVSLSGINSKQRTCFCAVPSEGWGWDWATVATQSR
jgi:hypothetical protein